MLCHAVQCCAASCSELRQSQHIHTCTTLPLGDVISARGLGFQQIARCNGNDRASPMQRAGRLVCQSWLGEGLNAPAAAGPSCCLSCQHTRLSWTPHRAGRPNTVWGSCQPNNVLQRQCLIWQPGLQPMTWALCKQGRAD